MPDLREYRALVTGASSGIGAALARLLAARGCDLVLTARRGERLQLLADELAQRYRIRALCVPLDLSAEGAAEQLMHSCPGSLDILINSAGYGDYQRFAALPWQRHARLLQLDIAALTALTHQFVTQALGRPRPAYVLNVASTAAYMPIPCFATYCGAKAYVRNFSESLASELAGSNVSVTCLSPGPTRTEFTTVAGQRVSPLQGRFLMSAERCARIGLRGMLRRRRTVVPGLTNLLMAGLAGVLPRALLAAVAARVIGPPALPGGGESVLGSSPHP